MKDEIKQDYKIAIDKYFYDCKKEILSQLRYAKNNVPYYKELLAQTRIDAIKTYDDFSKAVPVLNSDTVAEKPLEMIGDGAHIVFKRTSSSASGKSKEIFLTKSDIESWTENGRLSITPYFKSGMTVTHSYREEEYYLSGLDDAVLYSAGKITTFRADDIKDIYRKVTKADILLDYSEMIYYISEQIKKYSAQNELNQERSLVVSYTGEYLDDEDIQKIIDNFAEANISVEVYSEYSLSEVGPVACSSSTEKNIFKPIYTEVCFVEIVNDEGKPSKDGEIVITVLNREGTNLIRYTSGDLGEIVLRNGVPNIWLKGRKGGIKIASLFIHPQHIVSIIRKKVGADFFCYIVAEKQKYFCKIDIKIITPSRIDNVGIKDFLLKELGYIDDIKKTMDMDVTIEQRKLTNVELRKAFSFVVNGEWL